MKIALFCLMMLLVPCWVVAQAGKKEESFGKTTHVFKEVGDLKIHADVYRAKDKAKSPVIVWLHGGALIVGSRNSVPGDLLTLAEKEGFAVVSFDYRLAPEVKLKGIIEDVEDAFRWLHKEGPKLGLDPERVVVTGGSAGGYLTMMTGVRIRPRPTALVAYWGYGDVDGDWYTKPSEFYRMQPLVTKEEAYKGIGTPLTGTEGNTAIHKERARCYLYFRQNGLWTKEVTGFDPSEKAKLDFYCPVRSLDAGYPPILMIHGTEDTDVPHSLSADMAREMKKLQVKHELISIEGAGHGLANGNPKLIAAAHRRAAEFIREHLKKP